MRLRSHKQEAEFTTPELTITTQKKKQVALNYDLWHTLVSWLYCYKLVKVPCTVVDASLIYATIIMSPNKDNPLK